MELFGAVYLIGFLLSGFVLHDRAGFKDLGTDWRQYLLRNPHWFVLFVVKIWFWPATLSIWLMTGRGPSRWKAIAIQNGRPVRKIVRNR